MKTGDEMPSSHPYHRLSQAQNNQDDYKWELRTEYKNISSLTHIQNKVAARKPYWKWCFVGPTRRKTLHFGIEKIIILIYAFYATCLNRRRICVALCDRARRIVRRRRIKCDVSNKTSLDVAFPSNLNRRIKCDGNSTSKLGLNFPECHNSR